MEDRQGRGTREDGGDGRHGHAHGEHDQHAEPRELSYLRLLVLGGRLREPRQDHDDDRPEQHGATHGGDQPVSVADDRDRAGWQERDHDLLADPGDGVETRADQRPDAQPPHGDDLRVADTAANDWAEPARQRHDHEEEQLRHTPGDDRPRDQIHVVTTEHEDHGRRSAVQEHRHQGRGNEEVLRVEDGAQHLGQGDERNQEEQDPRDTGRDHERRRRESRGRQPHQRIGEERSEHGPRIDDRQPHPHTHQHGQQEYRAVPGFRI